jgi:hypothetical protein
MRYATIAAVVLLATITTSNSVCKATIDKEITYPKTIINTSKLTYPKKIKLDKKTIILSDWLNWVKYCSQKYGVDPYFALSVAECESSNRYQRFRFGLMGRTFYGPYGIHKCFLNKWDISDAFTNTEVGIRALARYGDQKRALKKYNTHFNMAYYNRIKYLERRNRIEKVFDLNPNEAQSLVYKLR